MRDESRKLGKQKQNQPTKQNRKKLIDTENNGIVITWEGMRNGQKGERN